MLRVRNSSQPGAAKALPPSYKHARNTQVQQVCEAFIAGSGNGDRRLFRVATGTAGSSRRPSGATWWP